MKNYVYGIQKDKTKTRQDEDKKRQDKTKQDKTRQDETRHDTTRQEKTRQDKTRYDTNKAKAIMFFCTDKCHLCDLEGGHYYQKSFGKNFVYRSKNEHSFSNIEIPIQDSKDKVRRQKKRLEKPRARQKIDRFKEGERELRMGEGNTSTL
jgi:hypothetical protein